MDEELEFSCPYCGESNSIEIYSSDGSKQNFIVDCEVCCRPIQIKATFDSDGKVSIDVKNDEE